MNVVTLIRAEPARGITGMEKVRLSILPRADKRGELINACRTISEQTRQEPGCQHCNFSHAPATDNPIEIEMYWQRISQLEYYFCTDHFSAMLGALKMLAIDYELIINDGSPSEGAQIVDQARNRE
jgi:quinol monooxygenase YgiN